ncbi:MAG: hypothetical protein Q7S33_04495 [Nanoarchaeota archaeon]|nr:hypothetical protein [Nanoarchaeota archaeon]
MNNLIIIIVGAILILLFFFVFKLEHWGKRIKLIAILIIGVMLYFSAVSFFNSGEDNIKLDSPKSIMNGVWGYFGWLGNTLFSLVDITKNMGKSVGNVIKTNYTKADR